LKDETVILEYCRMECSRSGTRRAALKAVAVTIASFSFFTKSRARFDMS
jgi:hypothetical protein